MRSWNEIIQDNAFGTQNESPFLTVSSCHMMYCILTSTPFNFSYLLTKRVEKIKNPLNAPSKTPSTNQTSSSQDNTSSFLQSKLQISPSSSHEPTSPQPLNPLLENILDVPPRPLNPQPLQSLPSLDITLSLSPITPLKNLSSPPLPSLPPPQPPIMGHPIDYNYHDYHGSTCICCFHNRNLYLNLRDEMNIMFTHLEYLLTTAFTTHFPPPP
ncbi:hypothetical protein Tco_0064286 [Tanacetum coccineum]